jgi:4-alpha-glucanotransferase
MTHKNSFLNPEQKIGGILTPISAVRGQHDIGLGDTESLVELAGWAAKKGFRLIQILPVNETGNDNSPYNLISSIAYEPCTLATNPRWLPDLSEADFKKITKKHGVEELRKGKVQYRAVKAMKRELLATAFKTLESEKGNRSRVRHFENFIQDESEWLEPYALFRALGAWNDNDEVVSNWPEAHRSLDSARKWIAALEPKKRRQFEELVRFFSYIQWVAMSQWKAVRAAFDKLGMALMGDIPVGVSIYSADVWAEPGIFDTSLSSGAPPEKIFKSDPFTENWGQNWGFPLYNWEAMSRDNFAWWRRRLEASREVFHLLRVDHALGFFRIWNFPWRPEDNARFTFLSPEQAKVITGGRLPGFTPFDDSTESNREYNRRQGEMLFRVFLEETGPHRLIAEDLGEMSPYVRPTLEALEIPGFKIPMWEVDEAGALLPGTTYQRLSLATFATHDHPTIRQYWEDWNAEAAKPGKGAKARKEMREILDFCGQPGIPVPCAYTPEVHSAFIHGLFASNSWLVVHQITDIFGSSDRFNVPGAVGDQNWTTRVEGEIKEWDKLYKNELLMCSLALRETGRVPASGKS